MPFKDKDRARENARIRCKTYRGKHPEKIRAYYKKYRESHKEAERDKGRRWYLKNREKALEAAKDRNQTARYGIPFSLLGMLGDSCRICGFKPEPGGRRLHIDHNHETREVRGKLCGTCNSGLGLFKHNPEFLIAAAKYLGWSAQV